MDDLASVIVSQLRRDDTQGLFELHLLRHNFPQPLMKVTAPVVDGREQLVLQYCDTSEWHSWYAAAAGDTVYQTVCYDAGEWDLVAAFVHGYVNQTDSRRLVLRCASSLNAVCAYVIPQSLSFEVMTTTCRDAVRLLKGTRLREAASA